MFVKGGENRRVPLQERSKKRVERILEAAALVFADEGYDAATMEGIAQRAETSIGSIYQFFPNKLAIFNALAKSYHERLRLFFDALIMGPILELSWPQILDGAIDAFNAFHAKEPAFRAVWVSMHFTAESVAEGEAITREFAKRIDAIIAAKLPAVTKAQRPVMATMVVEVLTAILIVCARRPAEAEPLVRETKAMLYRYLAAYEKPPGKVRSKR